MLEYEINLKYGQDSDVYR